MLPKKETIQQLSKDLSLPFIGIEQDWDLELADSSRINEFLEFYRKNDLSVEKKVAMMAILLASYDDYLNEKDLQTDSTWDEIKLILEAEKFIFVDLKEYWSLKNESVEDNFFRISPLIRQIT